MFLALTADSRFWDRDQEIVMLGAWCLRHDRKDELKGLNYQVLPYPWDDREKLYQDFRYLSNVYESTLLSLKDQLNFLHGTTHPLRYWRIVIGPWLYYYVNLLFEHQLCLK